MKTDAGSDGWYLDERVRQLSTVDWSEEIRTPDYVWTYGKEAWCNLSGQYVHLVADLKHLTPPYTMSICSLGVMGASYKRTESVPELIELTQGESYEL